MKRLLGILAVAAAALFAFCVLVVVDVERTVEALHGLTISYDGVSLDPRWVAVGLGLAAAVAAVVLIVLVATVLLSAALLVPLGALALVATIASFVFGPVALVVLLGLVAYGLLSRRLRRSPSAAPPDPVGLH